MPADDRAAAACARIRAAPANIAAGSASSSTCATSSKGAGTSTGPTARASPSWGLWGGEPGAIGGYSLIRRPGENEFHELYGHRYLVPAETEVIARQPGGGGWGDPFERDPEQVRWDVVEDYVSREAARAQYGVVIAEDLSLHGPATEALRREMRANPSKSLVLAPPIRVTAPSGETSIRTDLTVFATGIN